MRLPCVTASCSISTHVPRAGDDLMRELGLDWDKEFQPTSPVRETTLG